MAESFTVVAIILGIFLIAVGLVSSAFLIYLGVFWVIVGVIGGIIGIFTKEDGSLGKGFKKNLGREFISKEESYAERARMRIISDFGKEGETYVNELFPFVLSKFSGVFSIDLDDAPHLKFVEGEKCTFDHVSHEIKIGREEFITDVAEGFGEEIGHYLRAKFTGRLHQEIPQEREIQTDEFFGFLGRRILYENLSPKAKEELFPDGAPSLEKNYEGTKSDVVGRLAPIGIIKRQLDKEYAKARTVGDTIRMKEIYEQAEKAGVGKYVGTLTHYRGYEFASKLDLNKVHDWKKLFCMPDREVRMRFFTPNQDYSGL